ncbi:nucleolar GTP-binding protein 1-like isoform X1 [Raphanus sativus]|nr:nucleolar GTP-binding protein 1-like isoform X1 [Raphanus sativus]
MDKDSMVEVKNRFKKMSVVPDENCFANAILNLKEHQKPAIVIRNTSFCDVRFFYLIKLRLARSCIQVRQHTLAQDVDATPDFVLAKEDCTIPHISAFKVEKATDFVHQDTLRWLEELEEKHDFRVHDSAVKRLK